MHIKFLNHGKGSPAHASAYVLDRLDHLGNVRAGVDVLRGDATTFNAICDSSPHLWKYTSGVIAWSKEDDPTNEQIQEVLNDFEKHAFAGLEQSQYHLFAVLHTDDDGSKHIHVLAPRLDIESGKSLNIAPPGHEKHFDSLRDYFNTKYQWSRPDDVLLMQTMQEPNHIAKLNAQAKNILSSHELESLTKKQFCRLVDNYVKTLLKIQFVENRADIVEYIEQVKSIDSVKQSKDFLTVTLNNGKKHRLKGDFYNEKFEIGSYSEHIRTAAESRPTANELAAAIRDAKSIRNDYRAKREAYNSKHHAFAQSTANDNSPRIAPERDFDRSGESITASHKNADSELYTANRGTSSKTSEYRYYGNIKSEIEHRFVFSITSKPSNDHKPPVTGTGHQDRPNQYREVYSNPNGASHSEPKQANRQSVSDSFKRQIEQSENQSYDHRRDNFGSVNSFNEFLSDLSSKYKFKNDQSTTANDSTKFTINYKSNQILEQPAEISYADRNRPIFNRTEQLIDSTKQLVSRAKQGFESTSQFIKEHFDSIQRNRTGLTEQNQQLEYRERSTAIRNFDNESRTFKARTGQLFGAVAANISTKLEYPISNAINNSLKSAEFKQYYQQFSEIRVQTDSNDNWCTADRHRESTLENLAIKSTNELLRRLADAKQADNCAWDDSRKISEINQQLERLETTVAEIRIKPKSATDFRYLHLRSDAYYPDHVRYHEELCNRQETAYQNKKPLQLIDYIEKKSKNLESYIDRASRMLNAWDYEAIEKIIKNDERMLKYLKCEAILGHQNDHLQQQRDTYKTCLKCFSDIKSTINEIKSRQQSNFAQQDKDTYQPEIKNEPKKPENDDSNDYSPW